MGRVANGRFKVGHLLCAIAHGGQHSARVRILRIGFGQRANGVGARVHNFGCAQPFRGHPARANLHFSVGEGGAVLNHEHAFAAHLGAALHGDGAGCVNDDRVGIERDGGAARKLDLIERCGIDLVEDDDIGVAHVEFARIVANGMVGAQRVHHGNEQVGLIEGQIVVAAIPNDNVGFLFGLAQNGLVVHAGVDHAAGNHMRLILFAFFNRHIVQFHVIHGGKALHGLLREVAVGHGVAYGHDALAHCAQDANDAAAGLALACARARGADGNHGLGGFHHGVLGAKQHEVGAHGHGANPRAHDVLIGDIAVREDGQIGACFREHALEIGLGFNGNPLRIQRSCQRRGIAATVDVGDLGGREGHHLIIGVIAEEDVEVVKIAPGGTHDHNLAGILLRHCSLLWEW